MGYPDQGADHRLLPGLGWLQRLTIMRNKGAPGDVEVTRLPFGWQAKFQLWPPFALAERQHSDGTLRQLRIGWTWRKAQQYYMFGLAFKHEASPLPDYANSIDIK